MSLAEAQRQVATDWLSVRKQIQSTTRADVDDEAE
jgi:hypothetical protein